MAKFVIAGHTVHEEIHFTENDCTSSGLYAVIVGNDVLQHLPELTFNYKQNVLRIGEQSIPLGAPPVVASGQYVDNLPVRVKGNATLRPNSDTFVRCTVDVDEGTDLFLCSMSSKLSEKNLLVAPCVFRVPDVRILITNPTNQPFTLYEGQIVSTASPVHEDLSPVQSAAEVGVLQPKINASDEVGADLAAPRALDFDLSQCSLNDDEKLRLRALLDEYHMVFSKHKYDLGCSTAGAVHIRTTTDVPVKSRPTRVPVKFQVELDKYINNLVQSGVMVESNTPWTSPLVLVTKKDG